MARAVDCGTATKVLVAASLAKMGACVPVLERTTGFGARWARVLVKKHGGPLAYKTRDGRYFDSDANRRHNAWLAVVLYDGRVEKTPGAKLAAAYEQYRTHAPSGAGVLTINEFAEAIELYLRREAQLRRCTECSEEHLVFEERPLCPLCQLMLRTFCRRCAAQLADGVRHTTLYCPSCSTSADRVAERRRARRRRLAGVSGRVGTRRPPNSASWRTGEATS